MGTFAVSCDDVTGNDNIVFGSHTGKCLCGVATENILMGKDAVSHNQFTGCDNIVMGCAGKCLVMEFGMLSLECRQDVA